MIERLTQHEEIYQARHRWDNLPNRHYDWEDNAMRRSTSGVIRTAENSGAFVRGLDPQVTLLIDTPVVVRNWRNWRVEKFYNDHPM